MVDAICAALGDSLQNVLSNDLLPHIATWSVEALKKVTGVMVQNTKFLLQQSYFGPYTKMRKHGVKQEIVVPVPAKKSKQGKNRSPPFQ